MHIPKARTTAFSNFAKMVLGDAAFVTPLCSSRYRSRLGPCSKRDNIGMCDKKMDRRSFAAKGLLSSVGVVLAPVSMSAASDDEKEKEGLFTRTYKKIYAQAMETTVPEYEIYMSDRKKKLFSHITTGNTVVDVGMGTGPNLKYMPKGVQFIGVEPNRYMWPYASEKAEKYNVDLTCVDGRAEKLPLEDSSCDVVITTLTLCSVKDLNGVIKEILRVLKPGGKHLFIEHVVASPQRPIYRGAQNIFDPLQVCFADGCHLNRDTADYLKNANNPSYSEIQYEDFDASTGTFVDWIALTIPHVCGVAQKASL